MQKEGATNIHTEEEGRKLGTSCDRGRSHLLYLKGRSDLCRKEGATQVEGGATQMRKERLGSRKGRPSVRRDCRCEMKLNSAS